MSDNVGLSTPRGSGTSGFVQRSRAYMRPRDQNGPYANPRDFLDSNNNNARKSRLRQPDQGILDHDRKRAIEVQVFALRDDLEDKEVPEDEIERRCDALREKLTASQKTGGSASASAAAPHRFKAHQVHEQARAKIEETERLRRALHISKDYEEGGHWRRQEEKQALKRKKEEDEEKELRQREAELQSRHATNSPPPLRSVEKGGDREDDDDDDSRSDRSGHSGRSGRSDRSDHSDRSRGREDGRRVRQRRGSSPGDNNRSPSGSRSRSGSYSSRSRSRSRSDSKSR